MVCRILYDSCGTVCRILFHSSGTVCVRFVRFFTTVAKACRIIYHSCETVGARLLYGPGFAARHDTAKDFDLLGSHVILLPEPVHRDGHAFLLLLACLHVGEFAPIFLHLRGQVRRIPRVLLQVAHCLHPRKPRIRRDVLMLFAPLQAALLRCRWQLRLNGLIIPSIARGTNAIAHGVDGNRRRTCAQALGEVTVDHSRNKGMREMEKVVKNVRSTQRYGKRRACIIRTQR